MPTATAAVEPKECNYDFLFISSSPLHGKFPNRSDHLYSAFKAMGYNPLFVNSNNPVRGLAASIKHPRKKKLFSGYRAGSVSLIVPGYYDCVEDKAQLCGDNFSGTKRRLIPLIALLERWMVRDSIKTFTGGPTADDVAEASGAKYTKAHNAANRAFASVAPTFPRDEHSIMYAGKLTPMYGKYLGKVIEAMPLVTKVMPNAVLDIWGDGPAMGELADIAYGSQAKVRFHGYTDYQVMPTIVSKSYVAVNAYNTKSLKMLEWQLAGIPIISPPLCGGITPLGVYQCEWEPEKIAEKLKWLIASSRSLWKKQDIITWETVAELIAKEMGLKCQ